MGQPAAGVTPAAALDRFFERLLSPAPGDRHVHRRPRVRPRAAGLVAGGPGRRGRRDARAARASSTRPDAWPTIACARFPDEVDLALADGFLEIQIAEHEGPHFYRSNPALWTGEAIFSIVSLVTRDFAPIDERLTAAVVAHARRSRAFLASAHTTLGEAPDAWTAQGAAECEAAEILFGRSLPAWIPAQRRLRGGGACRSGRCATARAAFTAFARLARRHAAARRTPTAMCAGTPSSICCCAAGTGAHAVRVDAARRSARGARRGARPL